MFQLLKRVYYKHYPRHTNKYISLEDANKLIHLLGGVLILAHPYKYPNFKGKELVESIIEDKLVDGIECFHSYNSDEEIEILLKYAKDNDLYVTAGSDYHNRFRRFKEYNRYCDIGYLDTSKKKINQILEEYVNKETNNVKR